MDRWYAVHTHPRAENKALLNLAKQAFEAYLPQQRKTRRHARRVEQVLAPLFPRYLFVRVDMEWQRWRPILSTFGVAHLVGHGSKPTPVPEMVIEGIREREDEDGVVVTDRHPRFKKGESVHILDGPMADMSGIFDSANDEQRIFVLLELLGRQVKVLLPVEMVAAEL